MSQSDAIKVEGTVIEVMRDTVWRVELSNGHRLVAFAGRQPGGGSRVLTPGKKVVVTVSPCDLSKGRIDRDSLKAVEP